jgi:hypothetical protein
MKMVITRGWKFADYLEIHKVASWHEPIFPPYLQSSETAVDCIRLARFYNELTGEARFFLTGIMEKNGVTVETILENLNRL